MEFELGRIVGLREEGFSYRVIAARVQRNINRVISVWKQWIEGTHLRSPAAKFIGKNFQRKKFPPLCNEIASQQKQAQNEAVDQ